MGFCSWIGWSVEETIFFYVKIMKNRRRLVLRYLSYVEFVMGVLLASPAISRTSLGTK